MVGFLLKSKRFVNVIPSCFRENYYEILPHEIDEDGVHHITLVHQHFIYIIDRAEEFVEDFLSRDKYAEDYQTLDELAECLWGDNPSPDLLESVMAKYGPTDEYWIKVYMKHLKLMMRKASKELMKRIRLPWDGRYPKFI